MDAAGLERLVARLEGPEAGPDERIQIVRDMLAQRRDAWLLNALRRAGACEANAPVLEYLVRALGYVEDRAALDDLARFLEHPSEIVVFSALKSAIAIDPVRAVRMVTPLLCRAKLRMVTDLASILVERCPAQAAALAVELASSRRFRARSAAIIILSERPRHAALPVLLEMLAREEHPKVRELLARMVVRRARTADLPKLEKLKESMQQRLDDVGALIDRVANRASARAIRLPPAPGPARPTSRMRAQLSGELGQIVDPRTIERSAPPAPPRPSSPLAAPPPPAAPGAHRPLFLAATSVTVLAAVVLGSLASSSSPTAVAGGAAKLAPRAGGRDRLTGRVVGVEAATRTLTLEGAGGRRVIARCPDHDVSRIAVGATVTVDGFVKDRTATTVRLVVLSLEKES